MTPPDAEIARAAGIARKLTKAQAELCREGGSCVRAYKPGQKLISFGLWEDSADEHTIWPRYTPLGEQVRAILASQSGDGR